MDCNYIELGEFEPCHQRVNIFELVLSTTHLLDSKAKQQKVSVNYSNRLDKADATIETDKERL